MKLFVSIVSCIVLGYFQYEVSANPAKVGIRNGEAAKPGELPYMVELTLYDCFRCGGSIIGSKWILSAGHCVDSNVFNPDPNVYSITYGRTALYDGCSGDVAPATKVPVKAFYLHPGYRMNFQGEPFNDVALFELEEEIPFSELVKPIRLPEENVNVSLDIGTLSGWGGSVSGGAANLTLQKINLTLLSDDQCVERTAGVIEGVNFNATQSLCADDEDNGQCNGDSGGPFVINGTQYGVVSWSLKPCGLYPGVYTRVGLPEHRQWIRNVTGI